MRRCCCLQASLPIKRQSCGAPDYILTRKEIEIGYVEAKDVGVSLAETERGEQLKRYRRALGNLVSNALRHTPPGGVIHVAIGQDKARLHIQVCNTGEPIAATHLARLFERFYRTDAARQHDAGEGTGLGLSITQAIVRAHGGEIFAASNDGLTTFSLYFPQAKPPHS